MNVRKLIEMLQTLPQDLPVVIDTGFGGAQEIEDSGITTLKNPNPGYDKAIVLFGENEIGYLQ